MTAKNWQTDNTLCDLTHLGLLSLSGDDASTFLQGQVTNDVNILDGSHAHYSAYCSPKGRMLALFLAFAHDKRLYLQLSHPILENVMKRLKMYVMRAKVEVEDVSSTLRRFGINGPDAAHILTEALSNVPKQNYESVIIEHGLLIKLPSIKGHSRYEAFVEASQAPNVWEKLKENCTHADQTCWNWLDIQAGIPDVLEKTQEQFLPQMLNLDVLNGINFKKGCYTGQEIVARTHYLGKVKRRTYLANITSTELPIEGDKALDAAGNEAGQIVRVAPNPEGSFDILVELRIEAKEAGSITWNDEPITFKPLPYALDNLS